MERLGAGKRVRLQAEHDQGSSVLCYPHLVAKVSQTSKLHIQGCQRKTTTTRVSHLPIRCGLLVAPPHRSASVRAIAVQAVGGRKADVPPVVSRDAPLSGDSTVPSW